ncbi:hypothetical protein [Rubrivirga sp.]|uniref:hypothetical protein n=1 Tax=Rubrivirga sp. TaxID=1885344 RepID=UPI003C70B237
MLPIGALFVAFFAVAVPAILLMAIWAGVMAFRLLFPEEALPDGALSARERDIARGPSHRVRVRDIMEDQQARQEVASRDHGLPDRHPLFDDLWLRRN